MPLQNRVAPTGEIVATPERGTWMGNRGGCLHDDERQLTRRRWTSKAWIICRLAFKGRRRELMQPKRYTELFFLDEATALAAGHRPCYECRREDAIAFAEAWQRAQGLAKRPGAGEMDAVLHAERLTSGRGARPQARHMMSAEDLPDGAMIMAGETPALVLGDAIHPWAFAGYGAAHPRPRGTVEVLTPPASVAVLRAGYDVDLHPSAHG